MNISRCIPNILTGSRMILTFYIFISILDNLNFYSNNKLYFIYAVIVFSFICLTDFIDGKIARKINAESILGSFLDVIADFIFIVSSLTLLNINNKIPIWFTVLTLIKFMEFLITSYIIKKHYSISNNFFTFDYFGRIASINFFFNTWNGFIYLYRIGYYLYRYTYMYNFNISYYIFFIKVCKSHKVFNLRKSKIFYIN